MSTINNKDWFEFILDLNLLDNHFKNNKNNNGKIFSFKRFFNFY